MRVIFIFMSSGYDNLCFAGCGPAGPVGFNGGTPLTLFMLFSKESVCIPVMSCPITAPKVHSRPEDRQSIEFH